MLGRLCVRSPHLPLTQDLLTVLQALLGRIRANLSKIKVPGHGDRVRKTECVLSFDSPESPEGIFVSMSNFQGYGADYIALDHQRNGSELYLNIKWKKIPKAVDPSKKSDEAPTKLAIGVEGGFQVRLPVPALPQYPRTPMFANPVQCGSLRRASPRQCATRLHCLHDARATWAGIWVLTEGA